MPSFDKKVFHTWLCGENDFSREVYVVISDSDSLTNSSRLKSSWVLNN